MNFIQLSKLGESNKDATAPILRAMEQMENFEAEVILLYANIENIEVMIQQVTFIFDLVVDDRLILAELSINIYLQS